MISDPNRKKNEYDTEMARYRKELEDAEKAKPGTYTPAQIDELCKTHGEEYAKTLLAKEKEEEAEKSKKDPKYNPNQYYYTEQAIVPGPEAPIESGNLSEINLLNGSKIYIGSIAGVVIMTYVDKDGKTQVKSNGLRENPSFTETGDYVTTDYPTYDTSNGALSASERNRLNKNISDKNSRLVQAINAVTSSFNSMSDMTVLDRTGKILRIRFATYIFEPRDYDVKYSAWSGSSPNWTKDSDVKYLDKAAYYALPVAGLIWEINAPGGGNHPSVTVVAERRAQFSYIGEQLDVYRAYMYTSKGADAWRTEVTRYRNNKSTTPYAQARNIGVASAGNYYAVTGNRMDESTVRAIIDNVRQQNGDAANETNLNQTTPNSNPPVSAQSGNNGSNSSPSNGQSGNAGNGSSGSSNSGSGSAPSQDNIKGSGDGSGDVDKDDDVEQTTPAAAATPNYLVFGLIAK